MKSLVEYMKSVENKKRSLEENVDKLNEEIARLKSDGSTANVFVFEQETTNKVSGVQNVLDRNTISGFPAM